jgi:hypothetical protein
MRPVRIRGSEGRSHGRVARIGQVMERQWFVATRSGVVGPTDGAAVVALVRSGGARPDTQRRAPRGH